MSLLLLLRTKVPAPVPPPTPVVTGDAGGKLRLVPPKQQRPRPYPIPSLREGSLVLSGSAGTLRLSGGKQITGPIAPLTAAANLEAHGQKTTESALVRFAHDGTMTLEPPTGPSLEEELQALLVNAVVLAEALS